MKQRCSPLESFVYHVISVVFSIMAGYTFYIAEPDSVIWALYATAIAQFSLTLLIETGKESYEISDDDKW